MLKVIFAIAAISLLFFSTGHSTSGPEPEISPELKKIADCAYLNNSNVGEACAVHMGLYENGVFTPAGVNLRANAEANAQLVVCPCAGVSLRMLPTLPVVINLTMSGVSIGVERCIDGERTPSGVVVSDNAPCWYLMTEETK